MRALQFTQNRNPHGDGRYIPILDGWRAVAIVLVLLAHSLHNANFSAYPGLGTLLVLAGHTGALGVLVFFCISGYLITQRLVVESHRAGELSLRTFYIKRAFRILPPLAAYLLVILILHLSGKIVLHRNDWSAPLFMSSYIKGSWFTTHFWSLSVEEHFYLFWPIFIVLVGWRKAMYGGIALIPAVAVWRPFELRYVVEHHLGTPAMYLQHTDLRIDYIMMGAVAALAVEFFPTIVPFLKRCGTASGLAVLFVLLAASIRPAPIDLRSVQALFLTLMICGSALANASFPRRLLANRPMLFLGKISYSVYIWQQLLLGQTGGHFLSSPSTLPVRYALILLMAYVSYRFLERPFIRHGRTFLAERPQPSMESVLELAG